ncbi:MAG: NAD(P)/FAD-dependent oxidoreductase [bacterium]
MPRKSVDVVVVGSGPNGLSAAIAMAKEGYSVLVLEGAAEAGGGLRTQELTLPGFVHDVCATVHALGICSPFLKSLNLEHYGLKWVFPPAALAHPLEDGTAVILRCGAENLERDLGKDGALLGEMIEPMLDDWGSFLEDLLGAKWFPRRPLNFARFGFKALLPALRLARKRFESTRAQALFAGLAAHSMLPLDRIGSAAVGLLLGAAAVRWGWPLASGGSRSLASALSQCLESMGGEIQVGHWVRDLKEIPTSKLVFLDLTPRNLARIAQGSLPGAYLKRLGSHALGPGAYKMDWALSGPIPAIAFQQVASIKRLAKNSCYS